MHVSDRRDGPGLMAGSAGAGGAGPPPPLVEWQVPSERENVDGASEGEIVLGVQETRTVYQPHQPKRGKTLVLHTVKQHK